jgi:hypothetical protein
MIKLTHILQLKSLNFFLFLKFILFLKKVTYANENTTNLSFQQQKLIVITLTNTL